MNSAAEHHGDPDVIAQLLLTPEQAARALTIGRTTLYGLLNQGVIESVKVGALRRVPLRAVEEYVDQLCRERGSG